MEEGSSLLLIHDSLASFLHSSRDYSANKCCKHVDHFKTLPGYDAMVLNWLEGYKKKTDLSDRMEEGSSLLLIHDPLASFLHGSRDYSANKCCKHVDHFKTLPGYDAMVLNYLILIKGISTW